MHWLHICSLFIIGIAAHTYSNVRTHTSKRNFSYWSTPNFFFSPWKTNKIRCVECTGSWLWSLWRVDVSGELSASTGGAVDVLPTAAVLQLKGVESKGITPTIVLPITANYWSVTQLGEWLMAFQRDVEGFNYKQHTDTNCCSPRLC